MLEALQDTSAIIVEATERLLGVPPPKTPSADSEHILRLDEDFYFDRLPDKRPLAVGK